MTFRPVVPTGGYGGWAFLQRTMQNQTAAFEKSPAIKHDEDYFREKIGKIGSAEELVADRRLMKVALGAFGLDADIGNKFFIRKVLEEGTTDRADLSNKLSDKRYLEMSRAFGFGDSTVPNTRKEGFAEGILGQYRTRQFEIAVGEQNADMRIAMNAQRDLPALAARGGTENAKWYSVLGSEPMRKLFQTALGLPSAFGSIDIDQQVSVLKDKSAALFGDSSVNQFVQPEKMDALIRRYLAMAQISGQSAALPTSTALGILQGGRGILDIISGR